MSDRKEKKGLKEQIYYKNEYSKKKNLSKKQNKNETI